MDHDSGGGSFEVGGGEVGGQGNDAVEVGEGVVIVADGHVVHGAGEVVEWRGGRGGGDFGVKLLNVGKVARGVGFAGERGDVVGDVDDVGEGACGVEFVDGADVDG